MIYLIDDDRREQQKEYFAHYLKQGKYNSIITPLNRLVQGTDLSFLAKADCILIHQSFPDFTEAGEPLPLKTDIYEQILALSKKEGIPFVAFSNGFLDAYSSTWTSNSIDLMNKRLFYKHLEDFLKYFLTHKKIELKILTYGKYFIAKEIEAAFDQIVSLMTAQDLNEKILETKKAVEKFSKMANAEITVKPFLEIKVLDSFNIPEFLGRLEKILKSFLRYGNNIYN